jgi:hypothetical protein
MAPAVTYEYLFCLPSSDQLRPTARRNAQGLLSGFSTPVPWAAGYGQKSRYDRLPPVANGLGIIHPVSNMTPPLLAEDEGPPTYKELNPGAIRTIYLPHYSRHG